LFPDYFCASWRNCPDNFGRLPLFSSFASLARTSSLLAPRIFFLRLFSPRSSGIPDRLFPSPFLFLKDHPSSFFDAFSSHHVYRMPLPYNSRLSLLWVCHLPHATFLSLFCQNLSQRLHKGAWLRWKGIQSLLPSPSDSLFVSLSACNRCPHVIFICFSRT